MEAVASMRDGPEPASGVDAVVDDGALEAVARALVSAGRGILAADEDEGTIGERFAAIGIVSTEDSRRRYRQTLFAAPGLGEYISGVILAEETLRQRTDDGRSIPSVLADAGMIPGIAVDRGSIPLAGFPDEVVTDGLDGLGERLLQARRLGARFAKWRSVLAIGDGRPTRSAIDANAEASAHYAAAAQAATVVPIIEPDVLMAGDHTMARCEEVTGEALRAFYAALQRHRVRLRGTLLKTNMILSGAGVAERPDRDQVAFATIRCLGASVPAEVPGILLLSGGQESVEATAHLDAMVRSGPHPWELSFAFGRALQWPALRAWAGEDANARAAQRALVHRARMSSLARTGAWTPGREHDR
jgi:fructose-bisphosphate aldolase, class I